MSLAEATAAQRITSAARTVRKRVLSVGRGPREPSPRPASDLFGAARQTLLLTRAFYVVIVFLLNTSTLRFSNVYETQEPTAPLWPVKIAQLFGGGSWLTYSEAITAVGLAFAVGAVLAPAMRSWRVGVFVYVLLHVALVNSYGSINHGDHVMLFVTATLLFMPRVRSGDTLSASQVTSTVTALSLTQFAILLPYTFSGFTKLRYGRLDIFEPDAMERLLLDRLLAELDNVPPLLPFLVSQPLLTQALWLGTLYLEVFALVVVFRPHLHRLYGVVMIAFHASTTWTMNISFTRQMPLLGLFLLLSPLAPTRFSPLGTLRSLPIVGIPVRAIEARSHAAPSRRAKSRRERRAERASLRQAGAVSQVALVYDGQCPLCTNYAQYLRLRQSVGSVDLIDARQGGPEVEAVLAQGHDLQDGMAVRIGERHYFGHEALNVLALLSSRHGLFNRLNRWLFSSAAASRLAYPLLRSGRWALLKLKRVGPLQPHT